MGFIRDIFKNPPENNLAFYLKSLADDIISIINRNGLTIKDNLPFEIQEKTVSSGVQFTIMPSKIPVLEGISIIETNSKDVTSFKTIRVSETRLDVTITFSSNGVANVKFLLIGR